MRFWTVLVAIVFVCGCVNNVPRETTTTIESVDIGNDCDNLKEQIRALLDESNYCDKDADCVLSNVYLGCPFGCHNLVNKNSNLSKIRELGKAYHSACLECIYKCPVAPDSENIKCMGNKCVDVRFTSLFTNKTYSSINNT